MGKHSRRKSGYLPKVAAGAAPVALLFAAPATALATPSEITLPLDHRHDGTLQRDLTTAGQDGTTVVRETLTATRHDFLAKEVAGAVVVNDVSESATTRRETWQTPASAAEQETEAVARGSRHSLRLGDVSATTANNQRLAHGAARDLTLAPGVAGSVERRVGLGEGASHGVWLADDVDVLSQNAEQVDTGLRGTFTGDLDGALSVRRSSGQAVDLGPVGGLGTTSEQHASGQFAGVLDVGQKHEVGGQLGPVSGWATTTESLGPAGPAGSIRGDLGVDHVVHAEAGTTSVRGTLDRSASLSVLDQRLLGL